MSKLTAEKYEMFGDIVDELNSLLAEDGVSGVVLEVHRGSLSKSIRQWGDCACPTHQEDDARIEVTNDLEPT